MTLPKNKNFSDYDNYLTDADPTTAAQAQDYFKNQADLLKAVINSGYWQPETKYAFGAVVKSDSMPSGTEAVCVAENGGTSSNTEPGWGEVGGANISDGTCFWKLRWKHWGKDVIPVSNGGTGANSVEQARINLGITSGVSALDIYPVGSLYWNKNLVDPAKLFGGTWVRVKDKFILAAGDEYAAGSTGGASVVTLTTEQMPNHTHSGSAESGTDSHTHKITTYDATNYEDGATGLTRATETLGRSSSVTTQSATSTHSHNIAINATGGGQAHENMPPYVTYYCWERTA